MFAVSGNESELRVSRKLRSLSFGFAPQFRTTFEMDRNSWVHIDVMGWVYRVPLSAPRSEREARVNLNLTPSAYGAEYSAGRILLTRSPATHAGW